MIQRAFADLPDRQVHYRHGGVGGVPLLMLHASPASARQLEPLALLLAQTRRVVAPDRPGNGDSPALAVDSPEIADYAAAELAFADAVGLEQFDVYGSHTGACVAVELAILAPRRVRRVVLDGIGMFTPADSRRYLERYAPRIVPDLAGLHLNWAFQFCRDQILFFPWFEPTTANARGLGLPSAQALHSFVIEVIKGLETYHLGYNAAFRYDPRPRLPLLRQAVLGIAAADDPLRAQLDEALHLIARASTVLLGSARAPDALPKVADAISHFLTSADS